MLPILLLVGVITFAGFKLGRSKVKPVKVGEYVPSQPLRYLRLLDRTVATGATPSIKLLQFAYQEAVQLGDPSIIEVVRSVARSLLNPAPQEQVGVGQELAVQTDDDERAWKEPSPEDGDADPESWGELANPSQVPTAAVAPVALTPSPIDTVSQTDWQAFCDVLRTKKPEWSNESHLGAFEHRRTRLRHLGIAEESLSDLASQCKALGSDIAAYYRDCPKLLSAHVGRLVDVNGAKYPITMSGVLGLLKAAGPKGAEGWLQNPEDRKRFPNTTDVFTRCNGRF